MMKNRKSRIGAMAALLIISIVNYIRIANGNTRAVELISILVIGTLFGLLIGQVILLFKKE